MNLTDHALNGHTVGVLLALGVNTYTKEELTWAMCTGTQARREIPERQVYTVVELLLNAGAEPIEDAAGWAEFYHRYDTAQLIRERKGPAWNIYDEMQERLDEIGYLCDECGDKLGGRWPSGHKATWHTGTCDVCKNERSLANVGDWDWPDGKARGMRD